jgi:hypothetical protein
MKKTPYKTAENLWKEGEKAGSEAVHSRETRA